MSSQSFRKKKLMLIDVTLLTQWGDSSIDVKLTSILRFLHHFDIVDESFLTGVRNNNKKDVISSKRRKMRKFDLSIDVFSTNHFSLHSQKYIVNAMLN